MHQLFQRLEAVLRARDQKLEFLAADQHRFMPGEKPAARQEDT